MAKRRNIAESDDEENRHATPPSKRSRRAQDSDVEESPQKKPTKAARKQRKEVEQSDDDDDENAENVDEDDDDENRDAVMAAIAERRNVKGAQAEHGIIESIQLYNFMCHKNLQFDFGPQINFIIGHNGSGKSAVLSGITVALGGKANSTGRGNGLKSFIKEGESSAEVTITLKNQGDEAYRPEVYGKSILITRKFTKDGNSSWKITSKSGSLVSTKKDELSAICDQFGLQVDNPLSVLTQDSARQFLSASAASDKYKFFLKGTQLSQLSDEYDTCMENISATAKVLEQKKEALPDLRSAAKEAQFRFQEAEKAREQKKKVDELKKELAWSHVAGKEEELKAGLHEVEKARRSVPKAESSLKEAQDQLDAATTEVAELEAEVDALGDVRHLEQERVDLKKHMSENKKKIADITSDMRQVEASIKSFNAQIDGYEKQIAEETRRLAADNQAARDETERSLNAARQTIENNKQQLSDVNEQARQLGDELNSLQLDGEAKERDVNKLKERIAQCDGYIERLASMNKNQYAPYGQNIAGLLDAINKRTWYGEKPLGPLGIHVTVRDGDTWGTLLASQLRHLLTAFAITDARDRKALSDLLQQGRNNHVQIVITKRDMFDYSSGEPPIRFPTVLRALEITDPFVARILINQSRIERTLLGRTRKEGEQLLRDLDGGGTAWTADGYRLIRFPEGGENTQTLSASRHDSGGLLVAAGNTEREKEKVLEDKRKMESELLEAMKTVNHQKRNWTDGRKRLDQLNRQQQSLSAALSRAKSDLSSLQQEANNQMPANIGALMDAKMEAEGEKATILAQFETIAKSKSEVDADNKKLLARHGDLKTEIEVFDERKSAATAKVVSAAQLVVKVRGHVQYYTKKLEEHQAAVNSRQEVADTLQQEFVEWTAKAEQYCERVPNPRKAADVDRMLKSTQNALAQQEKRQGASVEVLSEEWNRAKERFESAQRDWRQMIHLNKVLRNSLQIRLQRWQEFRRHIALRCKYVFQYHLSQRGYFGKVLFDHQKGTLALRVQTDDAHSQGAAEKDARSLSGGEKSFSTICLLLSLWESIGCPLRCLDEFDVFMDAVNRRIAMRMMIDTADQSDKKQYILITPQDMGNIEIKESMKVNRMPDPERSTGTFAN